MLVFGNVNLKSSFVLYQTNLILFEGAWKSSWKKKKIYKNRCTLYTIYFAGVYFCEFRESGAIREFNNKIFTSDPEWMRLVYAIL